jgi:hypothetical protein
MSNRDFIEDSCVFNLDAIVERVIKKNQLENQLENQWSYQNIQPLPYQGGAKPKAVNQKKKDEPNPDQYDKILKSYTIIPKTAWSSIKNKTYIRYMTIDGILKTGGRIKSIELMTDGSYDIEISKYRRGKALIWSTNTKKISNIYEYTNVKDSVKDSVNGVNGVNGVNDSVNGVSSHSVLSQLGDKLLFDDKETIINRIDMLETRSQHIEQDLKQIFQLVKRIYKQRQ